MVSCIVFDLDGVVYKGATGIPGASEEIARLQKKCRVLFLTNNATKSRVEYSRHLKSFKIDAEPEQVMTSSFGTAAYISEKYGKGKKIYAIGESGLKLELANEALARFVDEGADIVAVGLDREINYHKLDLGLKNLLTGAAFILANSDPTLPHELGFSPGSGSIAAALRYASGREPDVVVGKPSTYLLDELLALHKVKPKDAAFVGDRLDIDIRMANKAGVKSVLVLTGVAKKEDLKGVAKGDKPDIVVGTAAEAGKALGL